MTASPSVFIGIDVSKASLEVAVGTSGSLLHFRQTPRSIAELVTMLQGKHPELILLEATGGYERPVVTALAAASLPVVVINPSQVRDFAKALGQRAKTDAIDAFVLARYAECIRPEQRTLVLGDALELKQLSTRRRQLVDMITVEKLHQQTCPTELRVGLDEHLDWLRERVKQFDKAIQSLIESNPIWRKKNALLQSVKGIGPAVAAVLLARMPELGTLSRQKIASLVGVAPFPFESGSSVRGVRQIAGGRTDVRAALFMATLVAVHHEPVLKKHYRQLCEGGKPKMVALVACMRKLLVSLNAMVRTGKEWDARLAAPAELATASV